MKYYGNPVSEGISIGNVYRYVPFEADIKQQTIPDEQIPGALEQLKQLKETAEKELLKIEETFKNTDPEKGKIFAAHREILDDEAILDEITNAVQEEHFSLDYAIETVFNQFTALFSKINDPLIRARTADLEDVKKRLLRILKNVPEQNLSALPGDVIITAHDLLPSDTATIDRNHVLGIITEIGGETSHSAIIARSYGIPAVLGISQAMDLFHEGDLIIENAVTGEIILSPSAEEINAAKKAREAFLLKKKQQENFRAGACRTKDGSSILIGMNIGALRPEERESIPYVDYIGLFRSEFLYMDSDHLPTEEEQYHAYTKVLEEADGRPVTLRTLDIGGDKTLPYFDLPEEENPFLGNRALRLCLTHTDVFRTQLRAALRAALHGDLQIMFPMVGSISDIKRAAAEVENAKQSLMKEQIPFKDDIKLGIMIEIPAIALLADTAARYVDFASIGTNDLCQYLSAADRQNNAVVPYYQSCTPALYRLLKYTAQQFEKQGKPVSVCGEMGGNPASALILAGLGIHKLSMSSSRIASVKQALAQFSMDELREISRTVLTMETSDEINLFINDKLSKII